MSDSEKQLEDDHSDFDDCDIGLHLADNRSYRSETPGEASDCTSEASTRTADVSFLFKLVKLEELAKKYLYFVLFPDSISKKKTFRSPTRNLPRIKIPK